MHISSSLPSTFLPFPSAWTTSSAEAVLLPSACTQDINVMQQRFQCVLTTTDIGDRHYHLHIPVLVAHSAHFACIQISGLVARITSTHAAMSISWASSMVSTTISELGG